MDFYNNNNNEPLKFRLNVEGIDTNNIETRLIFKTNENKNYLFFGKVEDDVCIFDLPKLGLFEKNDSGIIKFEIVSDDLYFPVWSDKFNVKTKASITFEQLVSETVESPTKQKPKVSAIIETIITKDEKPIIKEKIKESVKKETVKEISKEKKIIKDDEIKDFNSFFGKN